MSPGMNAGAQTSDRHVPRQIAKAPTGIAGLDELTLGGLPARRSTLLCGAAGCGKTLFAMTFLVNGATRLGEHGVFMSFEERPDDLAENVASLGFDLDGLIATNKFVIDHVHVERSEIEESGEYDLEGLFVRLGHAIDRVGAKRVALDTIEALFSGFTDVAVLRSELRRLFAWLKDKGVTALITAERGDGQLTRYGIEEYVSDCVILLDNRVQDQVSTRRLRIVKYRGSAHSANEFPFLIDDQGISVVPITSAGLAHKVSNEAVSTGIPGLDAMLGAGGYHRGSGILVSGLAGTGKSAFGAAFLDVACARGERAIYFAFEESPEQVMSNMRSLGVDLKRHVDAGLLRFEAARPSLYGFEMHLARMQRAIDQFAPKALVVDPISAFRGPPHEIHATLVRLADLCKTRGITTLLTSLSSTNSATDDNERGVSSLMDVWISLRDVESNGERNRILHLLKARGMNHSKQLQEYRLTDKGVMIIEPNIGAAGVLIGSQRAEQEASDREAELERRQRLERRRRELARKRAAAERQISQIRAAIQEEEAEAALLHEDEDAHRSTIGADRAAMSARRSTRP